VPEEDTDLNDYSEEEYEQAEQEYNATLLPKTESPKPPEEYIETPVQEEYIETPVQEEYIETPVQDAIEEHTRVSDPKLTCVTLGSFAYQVAMKYNYNEEKLKDFGVVLIPKIFTNELFLQVDGEPDINLGKINLFGYKSTESSDFTHGVRTILLENATIFQNIKRTDKTSYTYSLTLKQRNNNTTTELDPDKCRVCYAQNGGRNRKSITKPTKTKSRRNPKKSMRQKKSRRNRKR